MVLRLWIWRLVLGVIMCLCAGVVLAVAKDLSGHLLGVVAMGGGLSVLLGVISDILASRNGNGQRRDYNNERGDR